MKSLLVVLLVCVASSYAQTLDFSGILDQIVPLAQDAIQQAINQALGQLAGLLGGKRGVDFDAVFNQVQNYLQNNGAQLQQTVADLWSQYGSQLQSLVGSLGKRSNVHKIEALSAQLKGDLTDAFNQLLDQALGHLTDIATNLANLGLATIVSSLNGKKRFLESLGLGDAFNSILDGLTSTVTNVTSSVTDIYGQLVDAVTPHVQDLQDQLINHGLNAAQSLLDTLANISGTIGRK
jgi:phage-related protein